ncbi:MAG: LptF/LptG family permease [Chitinophagales bacterium]
MKKLDIYIIKKFLGTFFFILMLLVVISIVIDITEKIDSFIASDASIWEIASIYYATFIPHIATLLGAYFILVAVVFFTSTLASRSEIIAMTSGGVSFYRLMFPYFIAASVLAVIMFFGNNYFIPELNKTRIAFEKEELTSWNPRYALGIHRKLNDTSFIYLSNYHIKDSVGNRVSIEYYGDNKLQKKILADKLIWVEDNKGWMLEKYLMRKFEDESEIVTRGKRMAIALDILPDDLEQKIYFKDQMTTPELQEYIIELKNAGVEGLDYFELEKFRRTSSVFSIYILTLMGFSIASRKMRGGMGVHLVAAIIIGALFEVTMKFSTTFTTNADLSPFLGTWMPNIIFSIVAIFLVKTAQK